MLEMKIFRSAFVGCW